MVRRQLCPRPAPQATWVIGCGEDWTVWINDFTCWRGAVTDRFEFAWALKLRRYEHEFNTYQRDRGQGRSPSISRCSLHVDWRLRARPYGSAHPETALAQ